MRGGTANRIPQGNPRATYRLQFHRGFTLRQAIELVPYLHSLGISHIYASPLLKACAGSTHGYDVCDCSQLNPEIGDEAELGAFVAALRAHGMGLVLDIVPNHMAANLENPWWRDVLTRGRASRYAHYFDIEWYPPDEQLQGKLLLPVLGDEYDRVLAQNQLTVRLENGTPMLCYFEHCFPLSPASVPADQDRLSELNGQPRALDALVQQQHYRLACWRHGDTRVNYRRFFNITTLVGVRVEDPQVFGDTHALVLNWYKRGWLDGLRIDHPDGLRDPQGYLTRLRDAAPNAWIVVEKILEPGEDLPPDWPVAGTTGYDSLNRVGGLFIDASSETALTQFYQEFSGEPATYEVTKLSKKRRVLDRLLRAEMDRLIRSLQVLSSRRTPAMNFGSEDWREALSGLIACLSVYRTYIKAGRCGPSGQDRHWLQEAKSKATRLEPSPRPDLLAYLVELLLGKPADEAEADFVMRFQQLTGPAMAKGVEDTSFYCFNRLIALNEVGGDPGHFGLSLAEFHQSCAKTVKDWPATMLATSTHDTKRSEDVRARLALLSEIPEEWAAAARRWSVLNTKHRRHDLPDRNAEYLFYQTLIGAWPLSTERAVAFMEKASREAKQYTNWTEPNVAYDQALKHFVTVTMQDRVFMDDLEKFTARLIKAGQINSLAQNLIKLTAPGVPDTYQGEELWDLSLVDPDNRRPVDFTTRRRLMTELESLSLDQVWERREEGLPKLWLTKTTLQFRGRYPNLFGPDSSYEPLWARGGKAAHVVAFARGGRAVTLVPRLVLRLGDVWTDTMLPLPEGEWFNEFTGETVPGGESPVGGLLGRFPVALFGRKENG